MTQIMMALGILGTAFVVGLYFMMQQEKINPRSFWFSFLNGVGAVMIFASISYEYDPGDLGGLLVEGCWATISFYAAWRALRGRKRMPPPPAAGLGGPDVGGNLG